MLPRQRWTHRLALALVVVTLLLPVMMGSLTTTLGAGMAFLDWPTSDGRNMLFYDMLSDIRDGRTDKVAEHGHRLAGMVVGLLSIPLAVCGWIDGRRGVRTLTLAVLLCVIAQGVLGGARVLLDARTLAMLHSLGAAATVVLMALTALVTSRRWPQLDGNRRHAGGVSPPQMPAATFGGDTPPAGRPAASNVLLALVSITPLLIAAQYLAGGFVRHFGTAVPEHLAGAAIVATLSLAAAMLTVQSGVRELRPFAWGLFAAVLFQVLLGFGAWAGRFGLAAFGVVAVERGALQVILRTLHTAGGMTLLIAAFLLAVAVLRVRRAEATSPLLDSSKPTASPSGPTPAASAWIPHEPQPRGAALAGGAR